MFLNRLQHTPKSEQLIDGGHIELLVLLYGRQKPIYFFDPFLYLQRIVFRIEDYAAEQLRPRLLGRCRSHSIQGTANSRAFLLV